MSSILSTSIGVRPTSGLSTWLTPPSRSAPSSCCSTCSGSDDDMHPILFEIAGFPVFTYGVLLAAAYLLGLQFALARAKSRGLDPNRVMDLGIWIIISALAGAKLLLLIVEWDTYSSSPAELMTLVRSGGVFYGGLILAVLVAFWYMWRHRMPLWSVS